MADVNEVREAIEAPKEVVVDPAIKFLRIEFEKLQKQIKSLHAVLADHGIHAK